MTNPFNLYQKRILVTGASSGIGRETAIQCSRLGATIIATGRNQQNLNKTIEQLEGKGHLSITFDITGDFKNVFDQIGHLDGIVHSAGVLTITPFINLQDEDLRNIMEVNFFSPLALTQNLLKTKRINKNSSLVFISSLAGNKIASNGNTAYSASKTALTGFTRTLALELASRHIRVNCVLPGMVRTEMTMSLLDSFTSEQLKEDERKYPLGYGRADDVAHAAIYLLSDASRWVTGTSLILDGGFSLQ